MDVKSTAVITGWFLLSIFQVCICGRTFYHRVESLDNREVMESASSYQTSVPSVGKCARLCRQQDCVYLRHNGDVCSLYDVLVNASSSPAQGAVYYRNTCPTGLGYVFAESINICFKVSPASELKDWEASLNACHAEDGRLVALDTDARHNYIKNYIIEVAGIGTSPVWVGLNKTTTTGPFRWLSGSNHTTKWDYAEPDYLSFQNCVYLYYKDLVDTECDSRKRYVCELVLQ
ncbi:C-type lectin lectoxin-Phi1-like isoform X1 [Haliotis rufescens]|uniref:C-type lectin lectoxin-Phi1-like isoform X1 n=1 Tax=Haliotis rufescens TaxID=6454 RepID=UPI001EB000D1|nr:C-type lectin lectoxin-Phi1-like isoform X1 [Haliotis rufescens]